MTARQNALVPLNAEQQAAWRAVAETEKRRHQGNTLAEYPYAGAFFRCLNGSRRISLSDLRFFMPSLTAEELRGNRSQWLYAVDVLIETQGEVCLLPLTAPSRLTGSFKHLHLTRGVVLQRQRLTVLCGDAVFCQRIEDDRRKVCQFQHSLNVAG
ncbi:TPA: plasmid SOS inhibition protein A [Escherichia coli]